LTEEGRGVAADAVVVGWHRDFDFARMATAADAVRAGARFVATNVDPTFPSAEGLLPGAGAIVASIATAAGRAPEVAGKPEPPMVELVHDRYGDRGVMIGDRPSTDGALAAALGWPFALVLSGVAGSVGEEPVPDPPPAFVAAEGDEAKRQHGGIADFLHERLDQDGGDFFMPVPLPPVLPWPCRESCLATRASHMVGKPRRATRFASALSV
jgi:ribonucleotide monophosphatase NagD (HAD superfamily)